MNKELPRLLALDIETVGGVFPPTRRNASFFIVNSIADEAMILAHGEKVVDFQCEKIVFGGKHGETWKKHFTSVFQNKNKDTSMLVSYDNVSDLTDEVVNWFFADKTAEGCLIYDDRKAYEDVIEVILQHVNF